MDCLALADCNGGISSTVNCPDCTSGEVSCKTQIKNCLSKGRCSGQLLERVYISFQLPQH